MKFKDDRPFATPEAAERKLLELANAVEPDHAGRLERRLRHAVWIETGLQSRSPENGNIPACSRRLSAFSTRKWLNPEPGDR